MKKLFRVGISVHILFSSMQLWANSCKDFYSGDNIVEQEIVLSSDPFDAKSGASLDRFILRKIGKKPPPVSAEMKVYRRFIGQLHTALIDFKRFKYIEGKNINAGQALIDVFESFKSLKNPSLMNRFIELFLKADRLTRQYIFDEIVELKYLGDGQITVVLKGSSSKEQNVVPMMIDSILSKPLIHLQEQARFLYASNGASNRPILPDDETTKNFALSYLARLKFDLSNHDVIYPSQVLAKHPEADPDIDAAMTKLLASGLKLPEGLRKYLDVRFAKTELLILERNARSLSSLDVNLEYSRSVLSEKTQYRQYLINLLKFNSKYDLKYFPQLQDLAVSYFRKYPESLEELKSTHFWEVLRFKRYFNL